MIDIFFIEKLFVLVKDFDKSCINLDIKNVNISGNFKLVNKTENNG